MADSVNQGASADEARRAYAVIRDFIFLVENPTTTIDDVRAYVERIKALLFKR